MPRPVAQPGGWHFPCLLPFSPVIANVLYFASTGLYVRRDLQTASYPFLILITRMCSLGSLGCWGCLYNIYLSSRAVSPTPVCVAIHYFDTLPDLTPQDLNLAAALVYGSGVCQSAIFPKARGDPCTPYARSARVNPHGPQCH